MGSRGQALSAYSPLHFPKFSAYVYGANMKAVFLSGTLVSGNTVLPITHGLGVVPKFIMASPLPTKTQALSAGGVDICLMNAASAATSTTFYIIGTQKTNTTLKWCAWAILN